MSFIDEAGVTVQTMREYKKDNKYDIMKSS